LVNGLDNHAAWPDRMLATESSQHSILCLGSNFPINIVWGPQHTQTYDDGYRVLCGEGHPAFLGMNYTQSLLADDNADMRPYCDWDPSAGSTKWKPSRTARRL
jgi:hypothetical protein